MAGTVYLLHFSAPYKHARHYTGWTDDLPGRLDQHRDHLLRCPYPARHPGRRAGHQAGRWGAAVLPAVHAPAAERQVDTGPGGHQVKKIATYALIAFAIWWAVQNPAAAAHLVHDVTGFVNHAASSASTITGNH
jgi:hypothetical protein